MRFDLSDDANKGKWFDYFDSEVKEDGSKVYLDPVPGMGRVCFRKPDRAAMEKIRAETKTIRERIVHNKDRRAMEIIQQEVQTPEQKRKEMEMFWDHAIKEWDENIQDKNGTPIPCTTENKLELLDKSPRFTRFAVRCLEIINEVEAGQAEDEIKNS